MPATMINKGSRKDGSTKWMARWRHPDPDVGTIVERRFRDKRVGEEWGRKMDRDAHTGMQRPVSSRKTFAEAVEEWREIRYPRFAPRTRARYDSIVRAHLAPEFGSKRVAAIDRTMVRRYFARLAACVQGGELTGGTVHKIHTCMSSIMRYAADESWTSANPCSRVRDMPSSKPSRKAAFLTRDEIDALTAAIDPRYQLLVLFAAFTGLRQSEIFALRRRHIDERHGRVHVEEAITEWRKVADEPTAPREPVFGDTKSGKGRTVGLEAALRAALTDHLASLPGGPDALVFTKDDGGPIRDTSWRRNFWKPAVEEALPGRDITFHHLRHTCASMLIDSGANPLEIKNWMGHASIQTTYDIYGHLFPDHVDDLASRLSAGQTKVIPIEQAQAA